MIALNPETSHSNNVYFGTFNSLYKMELIAVPPFQNLSYDWKSIHEETILSMLIVVRSEQNKIQKD